MPEKAKTKILSWNRKRRKERRNKPWEDKWKYMRRWTRWHKRDTDQHQTEKKTGKRTIMEETWYPHYTWRRKLPKNQEGNRKSNDQNTETRNNRKHRKEPPKPTKCTERDSICRRHETTEWNDTREQMNERMGNYDIITATRHLKIQWGKSTTPEKR